MQETKAYEIPGHIFAESQREAEYVSYLVHQHEWLAHFVLRAKYASHFNRHVIKQVHSFS
jgi:hypothetical protein